MAITQNTYTGNGSTTTYSFTFQYLKTTDIKVSLDGVVTTAYTLSNATTVTFTTAPASGAAIRIFRDTNTDNLNATFYPGSAIRSSDLNNNFTQNLYVTQEADFDVATANTTANTAKTTADTALTNSATAISTANTASATATTADTNASAAVVTANASNATSATAASDAASAVATAGTASTNASAAVVTANAADANATTALNNSRESDGSGGFTTAISKATTALATANTSNTNSSAAVVTANAASSSAATALSTANAASVAVSNAVLFTLVANVAAIPGSPSNNDYVEIADSTGIESFTPLSGLPSGFVGASGLTVRLRYDTSATSWVFMSYFANDTEDRYFTKANGNTNTTNIGTKMPLAGGTFTGAVSFDDDAIIKGDSTNGSGALTLNCENNSHGVKIKGPPHSAAASYTLTLPDDTGTTGYVLKTDGSGTTSWGGADVVFDTTPQLGGDLDVNGHDIVSSGTNTDIAITAARHITLSVDNDVSGHDGEVYIAGGPLYCASITGASIILGSTPTLRGTSISSLSTLGNLGNSILSRFELATNRLDLYFGSNSVHHLSMNEGGDFQIMNDTSTQRGIAFYGGSTNNFLTIKPPSSFTATTYYLPTADGSAGQVLSTDGSGNMSWATSAAGSTDSITEGNTSAEVIDTGTDGRFVVTTEGSEAMRIDSSGRVGIGTTSPAETLHVVGDARIEDGSPRLGFHDSNAGAGQSTGGIEIFNSSGTRECFLGATTAGNTLSFGTSNTERMRIDSSGNVLIGGTLPSAPNITLGANGSGTFDGFIQSGGNPNDGTSVGSKLLSSGFVQATRASGASAVWSGYMQGTTSPTSRINGDGSATFAKNVVSTDGNFQGYEFIADQNTNTYGCFTGKLNGVQTSRILADGTATFGGDPTTGVKGAKIATSGRIITACNNSNNAIFNGYAVGSTSTTSEIKGDGSATFNGTVTAASYVTSSDQRFKENITDATSQLADVVALGNNLRNWDWTDDAPVSDKDTRFLGLVAQEAETISPGIVATIARTKDGDELTPEVVVPAVYETRTVPAVLDEEGEVIEPETTEEVLVTEEQVTPATYEQLDDSYKGIKNDVLVMKLLGAVAELSAKVAALEAS